MAAMMISFGSCFSSKISLNASANSFFMLNLLPRMGSVLRFFPQSPG
jgi:hypothetical protein